MEHIRNLPVSQLKAIMSEVKTLIIGDQNIACRRCDEQYKKTSRSNLCESCRNNKDKATRRARYLRNKAKREEKRKRETQYIDASKSIIFLTN